MNLSSGNQPSCYGPVRSYFLRFIETKSDLATSVGIFAEKKNTGEGLITPCEPVEVSAVVLRYSYFAVSTPDALYKSYFSSFVFGSNGLTWTESA